MQRNIFISICIIACVILLNIVLNQCVINKPFEDISLARLTKTLFLLLLSCDTIYFVEFQTKSVSL